MTFLFPCPKRGQCLHDLVCSSFDVTLVESRMFNSTCSCSTLEFTCGRRPQFEPCHVTIPVPESLWNFCTTRNVLVFLALYFGLWILVLLICLFDVRGHLFLNLPEFWSFWRFQSVTGTEKLQRKSDLSSKLAENFHARSL